MRYRINDKWLWILGAAYDTSPIPSAKQRPPALWLDRQIRTGTGVQYAFTERAIIGAAYEYLNMGEANIDRQEPSAGTLQGK